MEKIALALAVALPLAVEAQRMPPRPPRGDVPGSARPAEPPASKAVLPRGAVLEEVAGTVREVDRTAHRVSIDSGETTVTLSLDRNTMVYTNAGLGTVLDVVPGQQVRAGRNAELLAYWIQVRAPSRTEPPSTPGQGTGPAGGGAAPAGEGAGPGGGSAPVPPGGTGSAPPGGASPGR
jgi:hypothetical protein